MWSFCFPDFQSHNSLQLFQQLPPRKTNVDKTGNLVSTYNKLLFIVDIVSQYKLWFTENTHCHHQRIVKHLGLNQHFKTGLSLGSLSTRLARFQQNAANTWRDKQPPLEVIIPLVSVEDELKTNGAVKFVLDLLILFGILQITKSCGADGEFNGLALAENYEKKYIFLVGDRLTHTVRCILVLKIDWTENLSYHSCLSAMCYPIVHY